MPKVGKVWLQTGQRSKEFEIYYSRSDGFYLKDFPKDWESLVNSVDSETENFKRRYSQNHSTEKQLIDDATHIMRRYYEITATTKRVIFVNQGYGSAIRLEKTGFGSYYGINPRVGKVDGFNLDLDYAVGFSWFVAEVTEGTHSKYVQIELDENI